MKGSQNCTEKGGKMDSTLDYQWESTVFTGVVVPLKSYLKEEVSPRFWVSRSHIVPRKWKALDT